MKTATPGPAVDLVEDGVAQLEFDVFAALPGIMAVAVAIFGAFLLWKLVKRFIK